MAGFNIFNPTTTNQPSFTTSGLNITPAFGTTSNQNVSFGASAPTTTPVFGSSGSASVFGGIKPQFGSTGSSLFGATSTPVTTQNNLSFGGNPASNLTAPTAATNTGLTKPAFSGLAFGSTPSTQTTSSFGTSIAPQTGLFGTSTASQTKLTFGTPATIQQTGISFGTPASSTPQMGLSSGTTPQTTVSFSLSAVPTDATSQPNLSFGAPSTSTSSLLPTSSLGATAPSTSAGLCLSFGTTGSIQPLTFSSNTSTANQPVSSTLTLSSATTSAPSLFGGATTTAISATSSAPSLFGLSSAPAASISAPGIFSWQKTTSESTVTSTPSVGLGGVYHSAVSTTQSTLNTTLSVKEQPLPSEIQQTVASFKEYIKTQKNLSSEVARSSAEPLSKLSQQITALNNLISNLGSVLSQQKFTAEKIKVETIKSLNDYELAQKIKNSPVASEERILAVRRYFMEKISAFEDNIKVLQEKIEYVYQHVITLPQENSVTADTLKLIVRKLHDMFVVISARTYKLHNDMQLLKVQYLTLRNQYFKSNSSISFSLNKELKLPAESKPRSSSFLEGPNPFSKTNNGALNSILLASENRGFQNSTVVSPVTGLLNTSKPFGFSDLSGSSIFNQSTLPNLSTTQQFNLQKPPVGNKRGKR